MRRPLIRKRKVEAAGDLRESLCHYDSELLLCYSVNLMNLRRRHKRFGPRRRLKRRTEKFGQNHQTQLLAFPPRPVEAPSSDLQRQVWRGSNTRSPPVRMARRRPWGRRSMQAVNRPQDNHNNQVSKKMQPDKNKRSQTNSKLRHKLPKRRTTIVTGYSYQPRRARSRPKNCTPRRVHQFSAAVSYLLEWVIHHTRLACSRLAPTTSPTPYQSIPSKWVGPVYLETFHK